MLIFIFYGKNFVFYENFDKFFLKKLQFYIKFDSNQFEINQ